MAARITIERSLRDDDDATGQSVREWKIEAQPGFITVCLQHGDGFILIPVGDVDQFAADVIRAKIAAISLKEEDDAGK